jgi:hypothetical protein
MRPKLRARFWLEGALALVSGSLFVLTLVWRDWIEAVLHVDPDRHSGSLEWAIVAALLVIALVSTLLARVERNRLVYDASADVV